MREEFPTEIDRIADQLERSFRGGAWHGPALGEALDAVDAPTARRRFLAGAHTIEEIVRHTTFWIETARRRIEGALGADAHANTTTDTSALGEDWAVDSSEPASAEAGAARWSEALAALDRSHRRLHATVLALTEGQLEVAVPGSDPTIRGLLLGVLQHNAYHGGQVVLLNKAAGAETR